MTANDLHKSMVDGSRSPCWPFQKVVQFCLEFSILDIPSVLFVIERFAKKTHPRLSKATVSPAAGGCSIASLPVSQLVTEITKQNWLKL
jgi:hypothetical protein